MFCGVWSSERLTRRSSGHACRRAAHLCVRTSEEKDAGGWLGAVQGSASLQAESKDPFASRNVFLLSWLGIREVSGGGVRQAVFVVKPTVGARMRDKIQVWCFAGLGVVASNPSVKRTRLTSRRSPLR